MTMTRSDVVEYARGLAGLSASPACFDTRSAYLELIAHCETPDRAVAMATMSGCALVCRAVLRRFIVHRLLERPYRTGDAMADLVAIGRDAAALRPLTRAPFAGDIVLVGGGTDGGGPEHAWTVLSIAWDPYAPAMLVDGLDGGQRDEYGAESIAIRSRTLRSGLDVTDTSSRKIRWVLDVEAIITRFGR